MRNELTINTQQIFDTRECWEKKKKSQKCGPFSPFYGPHNFPWRNYPGSYGSSHSAVRFKAHHPVSDQESAFVFPKTWTLNVNVQHVEKAKQSSSEALMQNCCSAWTLNHTWSRVEWVSSPGYALCWPLGSKPTKISLLKIRLKSAQQHLLQHIFCTLDGTKYTAICTHASAQSVHKLTQVDLKKKNALLFQETSSLSSDACCTYWKSRH